MLYAVDELRSTETLGPEGWLQTGDIGHIDEHGYLYITDRKKDMIKTSGGKYVAPLMLESRLERNRAIKSAIAIGDERPYITALVAPDWEALATDHGITGKPALLVDDARVRILVDTAVEKLNSELARFETIKRYVLLRRDFDESRDELTPTGKLKRKVIWQHYAAEIGHLYTARLGRAT
jgi:long-chain acyl-CoA synthetase